MSQTSTNQVVRPGHYDLNPGDIIEVDGKCYVHSRGSFMEVDLDTAVRPGASVEGLFGNCHLSGKIFYSENQLMNDKAKHNDFCVKLQELMEEHQVFRVDVFVNPYRRELLQQH